MVEWYINPMPVQSARAVEYINCPPMCVLDMTLSNLMVRFQCCWSFGECGAPLHCHCSQVRTGPKW